MIKPRVIAQALRVEYKGQPSYSVHVDGQTLVNQQALPAQTERKTRRVLLPPGLVGYVIQITISDPAITRFQLETVPVEQFATQQLYHYWEVTFDQSVELKLNMDEVAQRANNLSDTIILTARDGRRQDTRRVYYPPLRWGYIPNLEQVNIATTAGQVHRAVPVALPLRYYRGLRDHSEIQVTYQGYVDLQIYLDGEMISQFNLDAALDESAYQTSKHYLPAGGRGHTLQWIQYDGDGEIALLESDITLTDLQQPEQPVPV